MTFTQGLWLAAVDTFLLCMAWAAWADFKSSRDPVDARFSFVFLAFAAVSIPLFVR